MSLREAGNSDDRHRTIGPFIRSKFLLEFRLFSGGAMSRIYAACIVLSAAILVCVPTGGNIAAQDQAKPPSAADRLQPATTGSTFGYLHLDVVEEELNLTATQCAALIKLEHEYEKEESQLPPTEPVDEYVKKMTAIENLFAPKLIDLLDEKQISRIREISIQSFGARSLFSPAIAATLHLSGEQKEKLKTILEARNTALKKSNVTSFQGAENVVKPFDDNMLAVLSPAQLDKFQKMHGEKINLHGSILVAKIGQFAAARAAAADDLAALRGYPAMEQMKPGEPRSALRLLQKEVVVKDMTLTEAQQTNIKELSDQLDKGLTQIGSGHSEEQVHKMLLLLNATAEKTNGVLSEQQRKRLRQIFIQVSNGYGPDQFSHRWRLQFSAEQSKGMRQIAKAVARRTSMAMRKETADKAEQRAKTKKLSQELRKNFEALLTPEQHRQFEAIQGKKIDISDLSPTESEKNIKPKDSGSAADGGTGTK